MQEAIRRDDELHNLRSDFDAGQNAMSTMSKQMRDLSTKVEELQEDLDASREAKKRADKCRKDKEEELEALKTELYEQSEEVGKRDDILQTYRVLSQKCREKGRKQLKKG